MGNKNSIRSRLLSNNEIDNIIPKEHQKRIEDLFGKYKDENGFINEINLARLMDGLLSDELISLIFSTLPLLENKFGVIDVKYLFSLLSNQNPNIKRRFFALLIFNNKDTIRFTDYFNNLIIVFNNDKNIIDQLINEQFLNLVKTDSSKISCNNSFNSKLESIICKLELNIAVIRLTCINSIAGKENLMKKEETATVKEKEKQTKGIEKEKIGDEENNKSGKEKEHVKSEEVNQNDNKEQDENKFNNNNTETNKNTLINDITYNEKKILKLNNNNNREPYVSDTPVKYEMPICGNNNYSDIVISLISLLKGNDKEKKEKEGKKETQELNSSSLFFFYCECFCSIDNNKSNIVGGFQCQRRFTKSFFNTTAIHAQLKETSNQLMHKDLEKMKPKFNQYEKENNGVFPLSLFEKMMTEIGVSVHLIPFIINYLKKKTQKGFLLFEQFQWIMEKFSYENSESLVSFLFRLLSHDKNELNKNDLFFFLRSFTRMNNKDVQKVLDSYNITTDRISLEKFDELFKDNEYSVLDSLEKIKYIPFIYFDISCKEKNKRRNCIKLLLKGESLKDYTQNNIELDRKFFISDKQFWDDWCAYSDYDDCKDQQVLDNKQLVENSQNSQKSRNKEEDNRESFKNNVDVGSSKIFKKKHEPKLNLDLITEHSNKLMCNLQYFKDFVIFTEVMWHLFDSWYSVEERELVRYCVQTDNTLLLSQKLAIEASKSLCQMSNSKIIIKKYLEIEIYPIMISFMKVDFLGSILEKNLEFENIKSESFNEEEYIKFIKTTLKAKKESGGLKSVPYSRTMFFKAILNKFQDSNQISKLSRLWLLSDNKFYSPDESSCFETENSEESVIVVFDQNYSGKWDKDILFESLYKKYTGLSENRTSERNNKNEKQELTEENLEKQKLKKKLEEDENKRVMVGMRNLGNSKSSLFFYIYRIYKSINFFIYSNIPLSIIIIIFFFYLACYMNSSLQILLNLIEFQRIFIEFKLDERINYKNNFGKGYGSITKAFTELIDLKNSSEGQPLVPVNFKKAIGELNQLFRDNSQQDSFEFLNFLLDILHEDTNINSTKNYFENPDSKGYENDLEKLANEYWANHLRRNCSFINAFFLGQMRSTLTCKVCSFQKFVFECFNSISLPIPESKKIYIYVKLYRLPITQKVYYFNLEQTQQFSSCKYNANINYINNKKSSNCRLMQSKINDKDIEPQPNNNLNNTINSKVNNNILDLRFQLQMIRKASLNINEIEVNFDNLIEYDSNKSNNNNINNNTNFNILINNAKVSSSLNVVQPQNSIYSSKLSLTIPLRLCIELSREDKIETIVAGLRDIQDLALEKGSEYTEIILANNINSMNNLILDYNSVINNYLQNGDEISAYEVLNSKGTSLLFRSSDCNDGINNNELSLQNTNKDHVNNLYSNINIQTNKNQNILNNNQELEVKEKNVYNNLIEVSPNSVYRKDDKENPTKTLLFREFGLSIYNKTLPYNKYYEIHSNFSQNEMEYLIPINHRFVKNTKQWFFCNPFHFEYIELETLYMIYSNKNCMKGVNLYDFIWEKIEYILKNPADWEKRLWWKEENTGTANIKNVLSNKALINNNNNLIANTNREEKDINEKQNNSASLNKNIAEAEEEALKSNIMILNHEENPNNKLILNKSQTNKNNQQNNTQTFTCLLNCLSPFTLKIVKKSSLKCAYCPWYAFCWGCAINPFSNDTIEIKSDEMLIVEWCERIVRNDFNFSLFKLVFNHKSIETLKTKIANINNELKYELKDCLDIYFKKESLDRENLLYCTNCKEQKEFISQNTIQRLPPVLILSLKRFKFTQRYRAKLSNKIVFPIDDFKLNEFSHEQGEYELFGVVCHDGSLNSGHYYSYIRIKNKIANNEETSKEPNDERINNKTNKLADKGKNNKDERWVLYNDSSVSAVSFEEVQGLTNNCYILFYKEKNCVLESKSLYKMMKEVYSSNKLKDFNIIHNEHTNSKGFSQQNAKSTTDNPEKTPLKNKKESKENVILLEKHEIQQQITSTSKYTDSDSRKLVFFESEPVITDKGRGYIEKIEEVKILREKINNKKSDINLNANNYINIEEKVINENQNSNNNENDKCKKNNDNKVEEEYDVFQILTINLEKNKGSITYDL